MLLLLFQEIKYLSENINKSFLFIFVAKCRYVSNVCVALHNKFIYFCSI